jgi:alpha-beta hydrolase superfamily lysophospholipase
MKIIFLSFILSMMGPAFAGYEEGVRAFQIKKDKRAKHVSHPRHLHRAILQGKKTQYAVVVVHGNFESPVRTNSIARYFGETLGFNTVSLLLPGYFEVPLKKLDDVHYSEWLKEVFENIKIAKNLGNKVIVFGHSLGGLLSIYSGYEFPNDIDLIIASAPAFKQKARVRLGGIIGSWLGISGNDYLNQRQDGGIEVPYLSPKTSKQVNDLSKDLVDRHGTVEYWYDDHGVRNTKRRMDYKGYRVPTMLIVSTKDEVLEPKEMLDFHKNITVPKHLKLYKDLPHDAITKGEGDYVLYNPYFDELTSEIGRFIRRFY